jgi:hypothetical protein
MRFLIKTANDQQLKPYSLKPQFTQIEELEATGKSLLTIHEAESNLQWMGMLEPGHRVVLVKELVE